MERKGVQGRKKPNVQSQIKALQKRCRELEYDVIYIKLQLENKKPNPIGFKVNDLGDKRDGT